jgi:hypothetical protein
VDEGNTYWGAEHWGGAESGENDKFNFEHAKLNCFFTHPGGNNQQAAPYIGLVLRRKLWVGDSFIEA